MQNQCNLNVRSKCILNAFRIRKGILTLAECPYQEYPPISGGGCQAHSNKV